MYVSVLKMGVLAFESPSRNCSDTWMAFPALIRIDGNEKILIDRPSILIGRSRRRADFQFDDPTVSSVHCEFQSDASGLTVRDLSRHGTLVNGRKVDSARLHEGDIVEIGGYRFHVTFAGGTAPIHKAEVSDDWFVRLAGMELGPMPWDELAGMAQRGELQPDDQVRAVTGTQWKPAGKFDQLFETAAVGSGEKSKPPESQGDTILPTQAGTVTAPSVFRDAVAAVDEMAVESSEDRPDTTVDVEKLPQAGWYYRHSGSEFGPVDLDGLAELAQAELLLPEDSIRLPGSDVWVRAREISGIFSTGSDGDSFQDDSIFEDTRFADPHPESASPPAINAETLSPPRSRQTTPATPPPLPPLPPLQPAPQLVERARWREKIATPVVSVQAYLMARPRVSAGVLVAAIAVWLMLSGGDQHEAYVGGEIQLDGRPLKEATITFVEPNSGWGASANLDENGRFEIATLRGGLKPGNYNVSLMPSGIEAEFVTKELQRQYRNQRDFEGTEPSTIETGMPGEVTPEKTAEEEVVDLPPGTIPIRFRSSETSGLHAKIKAGPNTVSFRLASE